jgi:hypothetical protein
MDRVGFEPTTSARCNDKSLPYLKEAAAMGRDNLDVQATLPLSDYMSFYASLSKKKKDQRIFDYILRIIGFMTMMR